MLGKERVDFGLSRTTLKPSPFLRGEIEPEMALMPGMPSAALRERSLKVAAGRQLPGSEGLPEKATLTSFR